MSPLHGSEHLSGAFLFGTSRYKVFYNTLHVHVDAKNNLFLEKLSPGNNDTRTFTPDSGVPGLHFVDSLDKSIKWYLNCLFVTL